MLIQERLQLILKMHNITPALFADKLGVQRSNVSHVLSGRNKPGLDFLEKILVQFPRVNAHWLVTGEMPSSENINPDDKIETPINKTEIRAINASGVYAGKEIIKIVEFYTDNTFKEYLPTN
jgi:transcriptional regulator with XRE-family HTH domain